MIVVLHIVVLCRFTLRSYAANVLPASYAWSTFTGPVAGEVHEVKPWKPSSASSSYPGFESSDDESNSYAPDYVAKPQYSFAYGVENPNTGESHGHSETRDGSTVTGEYSVMEPDGVLRRVQYTSDPKNGFRASVRYVRPDGEETPNRDHGYHGGGDGGQNHVPASPRPSSLLSAYHQPDGDDESSPFNVPPPQMSEYESDGEEPFAGVQSPLPLQFDFDKFNGDNHINVNGGTDDDDDDDGGPAGGGVSVGDYRDDTGPLFKFPSSSSAGRFFKGSANAADSDDYQDRDNRYRQWDTFGSSNTPFDDRPAAFGLGPSSSPTPYGMASSLSPSFGAAPPRPSHHQQQYAMFPRAPIADQPPPPCRSLTDGADRQPPEQWLNLVNFRTNHPHRFGSKRPAADDDDTDPFRSAKVDFEAADGGGGGGDDDNEDIENYESDDNDTENAQHVTDVQVLPSSSSAATSAAVAATVAKSQPPPPTAKAQPSSTTPVSPTPPPPPSSSHRPSSLQPIAVHGPSSLPPQNVTSAVPTVVEADD